MHQNFPRRSASDADNRRNRQLKLRQRILKLRWMGLECEADSTAAQLAALGCQQPPELPRTPEATD